MSKIQETYNAILSLDKDQQILLMRSVFLHSSFSIVDIISIKEHELQVRLQRKHEMLIEADSRLSIILNSIWTTGKKAKEFLDKQINLAKIHLWYSWHSMFKEGIITVEELSEYENRMSFRKDWSPTSASSFASAHLSSNL